MGAHQELLKSELSHLITFLTPASWSWTENTNYNSCENWKVVYCALPAA